MSFFCVVVELSINFLRIEIDNSSPHILLLIFEQQEERVLIALLILASKENFKVMFSYFLAAKVRVFLVGLTPEDHLRVRNHEIMFAVV